MEMPYTQEELHNVALEAYTKFSGYQILEQDWGPEDARIGLIARHPNRELFVFADLYLPDPETGESPKEDLSDNTRDRYLKAVAEYARQKNMTIEECRYDAVRVNIGLHNTLFVHRRLAAFIGPH